VTPFHLALPVHDLERARDFYGRMLGLSEKRSAINWVDYDFYGHQLSLHLVRGRNDKPESCIIDGDQVPARHFGAILDQQNWTALKQKFSELRLPFVIGPKIRFEGKEGEQGTMFVADPFGNYLEFKYFTDTSRGSWY
jgi:uncharacterized protein